MKRIIMLCVTVTFSMVAVAGNVSITAHQRPASEVFRLLMQQTGKNFVYSSDILSGVKVTVEAKNEPLGKVLKRMFDGTGIEFKIKWNNVVLKKGKKREVRKATPFPVSEKRKGPLPESFLRAEPQMLEEVVVVSRLESPQVETVEIGAGKFTSADIVNTPVLLGEPDVVKTLQMQPGVTEGMEGFAAMYVHGGNADENLYMLDNVPIYQVNHFAGLFSAFNVDAIRYIDFFKSSMPAKYDGRLSSFMDVRTRNVSREGHHGSAKLGLTSGAFSIGGPIGGKTTYNVALRRSWYDVLTAPFIAIMNASNEDKMQFRYDFMDLNAKVNHSFNERTSGFVSVYFGNDELHTGTKYNADYDNTYFDNDKYDLNWGNILAQAGVVYRLTDAMTGEFAGAYTRYFSGLKAEEESVEKQGGAILSNIKSRRKTSNYIDDGIVRADFRWKPVENSTVRFGGAYTLHSFLPLRTWREYDMDGLKVTSRDSVSCYLASEFNAYMEDDWRIYPMLRANAGLHFSMFHIEGKSKFGISPRLSFSYRPVDNWAIKASYIRTTQYVHQLTQGSLSLPTDQWIPVTGRFKPETADKIAFGGYWESPDGHWNISVEAYWKWMHNLVEYRDEYYLRPPLEMWDARLTAGKGTAKGVDFKIEKKLGKLTGHIAYSLAWSNRTFAEKNDGKTYPARYDNRHTINVLLNWKISSKVELNAAWTGHSGNRFTFMPQLWESPGFDEDHNFIENSLGVPLNNYQLPFYHRLDLSLTVSNRRGYWIFGLYNAYCNRNAIAITRGIHNGIGQWDKETNSWVSNDYPVFQKISILPIIPSISYTWEF
ncbi:MAG: TonB-dependent receptor plug domain-containing protein [Muribaculaceae bacterium]|nr:TonB-dependent receptor plug domain-containing protein [Muribaculaceae bacterium]